MDKTCILGPAAATGRTVAGIMPTGTCKRKKGACPFFLRPCSLPLVPLSGRVYQGAAGKTETGLQLQPCSPSSHGWVSWELRDNSLITSPGKKGNRVATGKSFQQRSNNVYHVQGSTSYPWTHLLGNPQNNLKKMILLFTYSKGRAVAQRG